MAQTNDDLQYLCTKYIVYLATSIIFTVFTISLIISLYQSLFDNTDYISTKNHIL